MIDQKKLRYIEELGINEYDANVITSDKAIADYFEELIKKHDSKLAVTWLTVELFGRLNKANIDIVSSPIKANALSELLDFIVDGTISAKLGKQVFDIMFETGKPASLIIEEQDRSLFGIKNIRLKLKYRLYSIFTIRSEDVAAKKYNLKCWFLEKF